MSVTKKTSFDFLFLSAKQDWIQGLLADTPAMIVPTDSDDDGNKPGARNIEPPSDDDPANVSNSEEEEEAPARKPVSQRKPTPARQKVGFP